MAEENFSKINILATIVLYNETLEGSETWQTLYRNSPKNISWLIINNGPNKISLPNGFQGFYHEELSNIGLASAYDYALKVGMKKEFSHIMYLDQDTTFPADFWKRESDVVNENFEYQIFLPTVFGNRFLLSPCLFKHGRGIPVERDNLPKTVDFKKYSYINSGALFSIDLLYTIWDNSITELFIDRVDHAIGYFLGLKNIKAVWFDVDVKQSFSGDIEVKDRVLKRFFYEKKDSIVFGKISKTLWWQYLWITKRRLRFFLKFFDWKFLF